MNLSLLTCDLRRLLISQFCGSTVSNLFENLPEDLAEEIVDILILHDNVRVERIISDGHSSPEGFWYDQKDHEWVVLLQGSAVVEFEGEEPRHLKRGDWLDIPPGQRHRVAATSGDEPTIWLAIFWQPTNQ